jgi:PAS domain S-box-containing protein
MKNGSGRKPVSSNLDVSRRAGPAKRLPWSLRLISSLLASIVLLFVMSGVATWNWRTQTIAGERVAHTNQVRYELVQILQLLIDAQAAVREFAYAGSDGALQAYERATPLIGASIEHLMQLVSDDPRQRSLAAQLDGVARDLQTANETLLNAVRQGNMPQVQLLIKDGRGDDVMVGARTLVKDMQAEEDRLLIEHRLARDRARRDATVALWETGGLGAILLVLAVYLTRRDEANLHRAERELATTLRSIGDAVIATDVKGSIRFMNPLAELLTGWDEPGARGLPLTDVFRIIDEETRSPIDNPAGKILLERRGVQPANRAILLSRDGTERAIADSAAPVLDESGAVQGMVLVFRDVSEERRAERTLQLRDAELQIINDYARFPVARCDPRHHYLFVNKAYAERLSLKPEDCIGKHIREVAGQQAYESIRPYIDQALAGRVVEFETEIPYAGSYGSRWMRCIYAPVRDADDSVRSFVAAVTDITERKTAEAELRRSRAALLETDRRKDEFIATLSHELRNPLAPIRAAAKIIASPQVAPAQLQRAQMIIERQVTHMALLLDDLLDIARITQGKLQLKKGPVALFDVVDAAVEAARPTLNGKNQELSLSLPAEPVLLDADPLRLSQILSNLLMNAAKYSDPGSHIEVAATLDGDTLSLSVKDDGIGIAPESINGIFEMFSQIEGVTGRSDGGLGIGLALVKGLTELHGGTVEAHSGGLGQGSEFIVCLPLSPRHPSAFSRAAAAAPTPPVRRRILIADDNRDAAESLSMLLELAGHEVRVAHLGRAALSIAQAFRPDTAVLDIGMPDLSGYEVAQELRQEPWATKIQLIALTGWGQEDDRRRARAAGFDHHLTKPIDPDQLGGLIAAARADAALDS